MDIKERQEITALLDRSRSILIITRGNPGFDEMGAALAWRDFLRAQGKDTVHVAATVANKNRYKFLPGSSEVRDVPAAADLFVIRLDVSTTKVSELSYDVKGDVMEIKVKPRDGGFTADDVSFAESSFGYDAVIVLGSPELAAIGPIFEQNRELFFNTPVINIDYRTKNIRYGQINAIYLAATSVSEITYEFVKDRMTKDIATCLLAGLIAATNRFQSPQVTPATLQLASSLIVAGAPREEIINRLFRTKDMDKLRVWGGVLSRLRQLDGKIVYSDLARTDAVTAAVDLQEMVDELVLESPEADIVVFFYEAGPVETRVYAYGRENYDLQEMLKSYAPSGGSRGVVFTIQKNKDETEHEVLAFIRERLRLIAR